MGKQKSYSRIEGSSKVYVDEAFAYRVNFAATVICSGRHTTRNFDTCFEMYDGHAVAEALRRRSLTNPKLAANIWRYIGREMVEDPERIAEYAHLTSRQLHKAAAAERAEGEKAA